jgi:DNA-directed RNA polymerase II subunit RPB2
MLRKDNKQYDTKNDVYYCPACKNNTNVARVKIPYAFKLLVQEMLAMNITPRLRVDNDKFN